MAMITTSRDLGAEHASLEQELERLRRENEHLRRENSHLRAALDAHVTRARSTRLFGPVEMTAGTSVGPRRVRH